MNGQLSGSVLEAKSGYLLTLIINFPGGVEMVLFKGLKAKCQFPFDFGFGRQNWACTHTAL